jgi:F420-dependent oxidoreductase-like protein
MALKIGLIVPQGWRVALEAEDLGYNALWLFDHFHTVPMPTQEPTFECWTSTAALARDTKRIRIGQMVTCNSYRNPALLAKMASTVDVLSHGRLDFGIGAGWYEQEYRAYGYDFPDGPTRLRQLRDAVQIIRAMWTEDEATFEGKYAQVRGAINQPKGVQKPHIPMLIAGAGEQVTLKLVAQYGDACNIGHLTNEGFAHKFSIIKQHCESVGRDYNAIRRTALLSCAIAATDAEAITKSEPYQRTIPPDQMRQRALVGTPDAIRKRLIEVEQAGVQELIVFFQDSAQLDAIRMFARECM